MSDEMETIRAENVALRSKVAEMERLHAQTDKALARHLRERFALEDEIDRLKAEHFGRVADLLNANNALLERARTAERERDHLRLGAAA